MPLVSEPSQLITDDNAAALLSIPNVVWRMSNSAQKLELYRVNETWRKNADEWLIAFGRVTAVPATGYKRVTNAR